ncbi:hypothetical protein EXIGLDRAFT_719249 [Exidia glandulosa HHB12029]|uniref:Uncharacterized protein n=1 Tax=Exidia glandulosa HHB12029 TaxID=1314781 RepID=A0A165H7J7_EXIGL|nr:hypothetical protein EXIGLDRAFT_719249 [Exidia glandulosa HHB12029]
MALHSGSSESSRELTLLEVDDVELFLGHNVGLSRDGVEVVRRQPDAANGGSVNAARRTWCARVSTTSVCSCPGTPGTDIVGRDEGRRQFSRTGLEVQGQSRGAEPWRPQENAYEQGMGLERRQSREHTTSPGLPGKSLSKRQIVPLRKWASAVPVD